jgi:hypothetical protein
LLFNEYILSLRKIEVIKHFNNHIKNILFPGHLKEMLGCFEKSIIFLENDSIIINIYQKDLFELYFLNILY